MRTSLLPLCAGLLVAAVSAQVSSYDVVVAEGTFSGTKATAGLTLANPTTQKSRPVQGITTGPFFLVALNTLNAADIWGSSNHICVGFGTPLDYFTMAGDKLAQSTLGCVDFTYNLNLLKRMHSFRNELLFSMTGNTGGLFRRARGASSSTMIASGNANHIAVLGEKIYFSTTDSPNAIVEVDMTTSKPKITTLKLVLDPKAPTGAKLPTVIAAMCNNGPEASATSLAVFDDKGILYIVTPASTTTYNTTTTNQPGIAQPIKAVYHPRVPLGLVVATQTKLYDGLQYQLSQGKPFYTTGEGQINDIAYSPGGVAFYGQGCAGTSSRVPTMVFGGLPYQGNSLALKMQNGNPSSLARLVIGFSNTTWNSNKLPLDLGFLGAAGCNLLASIDLMLTVGTDAKGEINIPNKIPVDSKLVGVTAYLQFAVADKVNPAGLVTSNAMQLVIR